MNDYIADRLREWAQWSATREAGYYGLTSSQFDYEEPPLKQERGQLREPLAPRCIETEEGVAWLLMESHPLGLAVMLHYRDRPFWSAEVQAAALSCGLRTLWWRLNRAHTLLLGYFLDRACGILPQTESLRIALREARLRADAE